MSDVGDNSIAHGQLKSIVERIESLEEDKKAIADDIKDVYGEAKGNGFDTKALRRIIALRKKDPAEREEEEATLELYMHALGMHSDRIIDLPPLQRAERALDQAEKKIKRRREKAEDA